MSTQTLTPETLTPETPTDENLSTSTEQKKIPILEYNNERYIYIHILPLIRSEKVLQVFSERHHQI
jgi:hypothetical protein